jgi:uncharacterized protein with FMN-binding domain
VKKFIVALLIIGSFILYSFLYSHDSTVALVPTNPTPSSSSSSSSSRASSSVPTAPATGGTSGSGSQPAPTPTSLPGALYKDGTYMGSVADAQWGNLQVKVVISNGKITDVPFLQYPSDRNRSVMINSYADPQLTSEAIQAQSANVDIITGATDSSEAFIQSLSDALAQAKA